MLRSLPLPRFNSTLSRSRVSADIIEIIVSPSFSFVHVPELPRSWRYPPTLLITRPTPTTRARRGRKEHERPSSPNGQSKRERERETPKQKQRDPVSPSRNYWVACAATNPRVETQQQKQKALSAHPESFYALWCGVRCTRVCVGCGEADTRAWALLARR